MSPRFFTRHGRWVVLSVIFFVPLLASASPVIRSGESISLKEDQSVSGDLYAFGATVASSANVAGDVYVGGGTVTINGDVAQDLVAAAGTVQVHAPVKDDVRVVGGQVVIAGKVSGDLAVIGGEVTVLSTAQIMGDVLFYGGSLDIKGPVQGTVFGSGEHITIDARVAGDVMVTAYTELELGSHADIGGGLTYQSPKELVRALESVVEGQVVRKNTGALDSTNYRPSIFPFLVLLFSALVVRFIFGSRMDGLLNDSMASFGKCGLIGFGVLLLGPIAILLSFVSVLGLLVGVVLLSIYVLLLSISWILSGILLGGQIMRFVKNKPDYGIVATIVGTSGLFILSIIPAIGSLLGLVVVLIVLGGIATKIYATFR